MAIRRPGSSSRTKPAASSSSKAKVPDKQPSRLVNMAARKQSSLEDVTMDEQLVDHSGVFRVTTAIAQAQTGHGEESTRFPSDSLVMAAQRDAFRDDGPTIDEAVEENAVDDEHARAERKARLATLAARARQQNKSRR